MLVEASGDGGASGNDVVRETSEDELVMEASLEGGKVYYVAIPLSTPGLSLHSKFDVTLEYEEQDKEEEKNNEDKEENKDTNNENNNDKEGNKDRDFMRKYWVVRLILTD